VGGLGLAALGLRGLALALLARQALIFSLRHADWRGGSDESAPRVAVRGRVVWSASAWSLEADADGAA
jgi:hypothetical protein